MSAILRPLSSVQALSEPGERIARATEELQAATAWQRGSGGSEQPSSSAAPRQALVDRIGNVIRQSVAEGTTADLILIDFNDFAEINAAWGMALGDETLAAARARIESFVAERFTPSLAGECFVDRLDADHFVVVASKVTSQERLRSGVGELVRALAQPFSLGGQALALNARAAIVSIPEHGRSVTMALGRGFRLLNTIARTKPDGVAVSEAASRQSAAVPMIERELAAALSTDQLFIALQPKVEAATGTVQGAEALARWRHPDRGMLAPGSFIGAAEKSGLIFDLGLRMLRDACRAGNQISGTGKALPIAVNVSPHQLENPDFLSRFLEVIDRESVAPASLSVEVTETAAMMGGEQISRTLQSLRHCGIGVAIDDFGTGFSNLASLSSLPADTLKIDRSLVVGGEQGGKGAALLEIAVKLGRTFGMSTVAEGVETPRQFRHVTDLGCDLVQGYLTGRPVGAAEFADRYLGA